MAGVDPISGAMAALQTGFGIYQAISGTSKLNSLLRQREAYRTPDAINKILNLSLSQAGGDTQTRDYQTGQLDRAFSGMEDTAQRLGADPNDLSALFDQKINGLLKIGEQYHASNLESIGKVYNALNLVADNKAAEWKSQQDILKDKMQAASGQAQAGYANISGGLSTATSALAASRAAKLYGGGGKSNILGTAISALAPIAGDIAVGALNQGTYTGALPQSPSSSMAIPSSTNAAFTGALPQSPAASMAVTDPYNPAFIGSLSQSPSPAMSADTVIVEIGGVKYNTDDLINMGYTSSSLNAGLSSGKIKVVK